MGYFTIKVYLENVIHKSEAGQQASVCINVFMLDCKIKLSLSLSARRGKRPGKRIEEDSGEDGHSVDGGEEEREFTDEELARFLCTDPKCFQVIYCYVALWQDSVAPL